MNRSLTALLGAAALAAALGGEADAQGRRFDVGLYAGGAYTSGWFEAAVPGDSVAGGGETYRVGVAPILGAAATFWARPSIGLRLHGAYMPSGLPSPESFGSGMEQDNLLTDLSLVFRPFHGRAGRLSSAYVFAGGGMLRTHVDAEGDARCLFVPQGACLSSDANLATVGQGVLGIGADLRPVSRTLWLFTELAAHGYDSPAHNHCHFIGQCRTPARDYDLAVTGRLSLGLKWMPGAPATAMLVTNLPAPVPTASPPPQPVLEPAMQPVRVCIAERDGLREVEALRDPATGDTLALVAGERRRFQEAYPERGAYAAGTTWYITADSVRVENRRYTRVGLPQVIEAGRLARAGEFQGVGVFAEAGAARPAGTVYLPLSPGCVFQEYRYDQELRRVRG